MMQNFRKKWLLQIALLGFVIGPVWAQEETGLASYYGDEFNGRKTSSGEIYDPTLMTAAHRLLRFGIRLEVTNLDNGKKVEVTVNDRGPFVEGRIIDLSKAAAQALDMLGPGLAHVRLRPLLSGETVSTSPSTTVTSPAVVMEPDSLYFQMGAFRTQYNAFRLAMTLFREGFEPQLRQEGSLFRVYLRSSEGPLAQELVERLKRTGHTGFLQMAREPNGREIPLKKDTGLLTTN